MTIYPTTEAIAFIGIALQALAIGWIWRDWQMSQYQSSDWKKAHRKSENQTLRSLSDLRIKFGGPASSGPINWDNIGAVELESISKEFPASGDDETLKKRKIDAVTLRFGIGPSDADLTRIRKLLERLALHRRGVVDYKTFIRKSTFGMALRLMLFGFALQLVATWPSHWVIQVDQPAKGNEASQP